MVECYTLTALDEVAETLGVEPPAGPPRFNIPPLQIAPIRTAEGLAAGRWGLLPPWRGHGGNRAPHIFEAPVDALHVPILRNAFKNQRCLVIADGFFLWQRTGKKLHPPEGWRADPVSNWVNSENHDDARCVEPLGNPAQGELF